MQIFYWGNKNVLLTFILTPIFSFQIIQHSKWLKVWTRRYSRSWSLISRARVVLRAPKPGLLSVTWVTEFKHACRSCMHFHAWLTVQELSHACMSSCLMHACMKMHANVPICLHASCMPHACTACTWHACSMHACMHDSCM